MWPNGVIINLYQKDCDTCIHEGSALQCINFICLVGCFSTTEKGGANYKREILMNIYSQNTICNIMHNESCKVTMTFINSLHVSRLSSWLYIHVCKWHIIEPHKRNNEMGYMVIYKE